MFSDEQLLALRDAILAAQPRESDTANAQRTAVKIGREVWAGVHDGYWFGDAFHQRPSKDEQAAFSSKVKKLSSSLDRLCTLIDSFSEEEAQSLNALIECIPPLSRFPKSALTFGGAATPEFVEQVMKNRPHVMAFLDLLDKSNADAIAPMSSSLDGVALSRYANVTPLNRLRELRKQATFFELVARSANRSPRGRSPSWAPLMFARSAIFWREATGSLPRKMRDRASPAQPSRSPLYVCIVALVIEAGGRDDATGLSSETYAEVLDFLRKPNAESDVLHRQRVSLPKRRT